MAAAAMKTKKTTRIKTFSWSDVLHHYMTAILTRYLMLFNNVNNKFQAHLHALYQSDSLNLYLTAPMKTPKIF